MKIGTAKPFTWSYSKLSLYESCPAKYKYRYLEGLKTPKAAAASRGTEIHEGVENYLHRRVETVPAPAAAFFSIIAEVREHKPKIEHKIGFDKNWQPAPWDDAWGRSVIDAGYCAKSEVHIQEWKSGKIYDDHADQRRLYSTLGSLVWPAAKSFTIRTYYFDQGVIKKLTITADDMEAIKDDFSRRVYFMEIDDECAPRPSWSCNFCDYSRLKGGVCKRG